MLSSLPCFYAFCWSAIPTSCYIFNVFFIYVCQYILIADLMWSNRKREFSDTNSEIRKTLLIFWLNALVFIRVQVKNSVKTFNIYSHIYIHFRRYVIGCHWRSKNLISDDCSSPFMSPYQCNLSQLKCSFVSVICVCRASFSSISSCPLALSSTDFSVCRHAIVIHRLWSNFPLNSS